MDKNLPLTELYNSYKTWVKNNPNLVTDVETVVTWSSYFVAGKINKSPIVSELVYSLSKLLSLHNDSLIREAYNTDGRTNGLRDKIKVWLTIIHYSEVFIELLVRKKYDNKGKWTIATILQVLKCTANLVLLFKYREMPIQHPPVPTLQRKKFVEAKDSNENINGSFTLRRSGRVLRSVEGAPPAAFRDWQPVKTCKESQNPNINVKDLMYAESIHILKPLLHLASMRVFGTKAWKQWLVSLSMDLISLKVYSKYMKELSYDQRLEISRRKLGLLLYLLRSPMYAKFSKNVIESALNSTAKKIPLTAFITNPVLQYLSHWQDIYFYMWAS